MSFKNKLFSLIILGIYCLICINIYQGQQQNKIIINSKRNTATPRSAEVIGNLKIDKLNLQKPLFPIESPHNHVDENVTILKESTFPDQEESILLLAAHSGKSKVSFFENLDKLTENDQIDITYKNNQYHYKITKIREEEKNGYIHINKNKRKQLILTTCSPTHENKQLIIESIML